MVKETKNTTSKVPAELEKVAGSSTNPPGIWQDARFQHLVADPRFKRLPNDKRKVTIDKRFQGMFTNEKFKTKYTVDKYGRVINESSANELRKYYELETSSSEDEAKAEAQEKRKEEKAISRDTDASAAAYISADEAQIFENDSDANSAIKVPTTLREQLLDPDIDYARGEGRLITDSSSGEETSDDENDPGLKIDHVWGELDIVADTTEESTHRLAVCNMDWDRVRASDLMVLFCSFLPPGGSVLSVTIYPSQYGKERLAEEEAHGPAELVGMGKSDKLKDKTSSQPEAKDSVDTATDASDANESETDEHDEDQDSDAAAEGDEYHMEKLRQYQLNRLRYYYAVVVCDSVQTADKIYSECDGIEYESSATKIDLRFVPDDTNFDEDKPIDSCTELPEIGAYQPRQFTTTALHQAKVDLTWDETAVERRELGDKLSSGKLAEVSDKDLRTIVSYSSEEDVDNEDETIDDKLHDEVAEANNNEKGTLPAAEQAKMPSQTGKQRKKQKRGYYWKIQSAAS